MKQLIVNADDFGRSPGVNRGILAAHHHGILTSTTVMVNYPDAAPGIEQVLTDAPDLGLGLHITLTSGQPVSPPDTIPSLLNDNGEFHHIRDWPTVYDTLAPDHIQREIETQVERFISLVGAPPDHFDSHHHAAYLHPAALRTLFRIARQYNVPLRDTKLTGSVDDTITALVHVVPGLQPESAARLFTDLQPVIADGPPPFTPAHLEMGYFGARATLGDLLVILTTLPDDSITELMCHPGYTDAALAGSSYQTQREDEVAHLTHTATLECIQAEGIKLITFADMAR